MKVLLHYPDWKNRWTESIQKVFEDHDLTVTHSREEQEIHKLSEDKDMLVSMWANSILSYWTRNFSDKIIVTYLRRFELWEPKLMISPDWTKVDLCVFVSDWCRGAANMMWQNYKITSPKRQIVIPNGIDFNEFPLRKEKPNTKKIALVCSLKEVKNVPLALQILLELPKDYTLHHIGIPFSSQMTGQIMSYAYELDLIDRVEWGKFIPKNEMVKWLMDKDYILSTSLNEGNPNNVIECMAMGIKPVIHNWPGAKSQFPEDLIFTRVSGAVDIITGESYNPISYRNWVINRYGLENFDILKSEIGKLCPVMV